MELLIRLIAYYEIACGAIGLFYGLMQIVADHLIGPPESNQPLFSYISISVLSIIIFIAGWQLRKNKLVGLKLSIAVQIIQTPIIIINSLGYIFIPIFGYLILFSSHGWMWGLNCLNLKIVTESITGFAFGINIFSSLLLCLLISKFIKKEIINN